MIDTPNDPDARDIADDELLAEEITDLADLEPPAPDNPAVDETVDLPYDPTATL